LGLVIVLAACDPQSKENGDGNVKDSVAQNDQPGQYGAALSDKTVATASLDELLGDQENVHAKLKVKIKDVCKKKGCWMLVETETGEEMRVTFKDYGFFVPTNSAGQTAIIEGVAERTVTDVATLQHYAQDEGKTEEEVAAITSPKDETGFVATGVLIEG